MGATRVLIIANPAAGTVTPALVWELVRVCRSGVRDVSVRWTTGPGEATGIARKAAESAPPSVAERALALPTAMSATVSAAAPARRTVVVAVGGDGTVREVAAGLASAWRGAGPTPLLIVPAGTANSCYHTLFGTAPWQSVVSSALREPVVRWLDLARVAGRLVFAGASAGISPRAIHEARALTSHVGPSRYHAALVDLIPRYRPYPGRVTVDDRLIHSGSTLLVNVGGSRYRGGHFELLPRSLPDDGLLDVCVLGGEHSVAEMMELTRTGAHLSRPGVVYERGRRVRIERTDGRPLWFEHDGEVLPLGPTEYTVDVVPAAVPALATPSLTAAA
ncbi:diacylglycerol/lipid kinase family protein [Actinophytocola sp.]|uniref:diacylglycerol/lipid kinase family protein n=1 Tax=Actinophytocola sp. TaxID=1872138 RepID=UPI0038998703